MEQRITFVDTPEALEEVLAELPDPLLGVDVERADADNYYRRAALVQVGNAEHVVLVDAVAMPKLPALADHLATRTTILHALENDLVPMDTAGVELHEVHDTAVAAALLGLPTGLDPLLQELLDVSLTPDKERFQRADWTIRPLPEDMEDYAADDVFHLPALWSLLRARLEDAGRWHWYEQELAEMVVKARDDRRDWTRTRGAGKLSPHEREVLRELWQEREDIAQSGDIAPSRILREATLLDLAQKPAKDPNDLIRRNQRRRRPTEDQAERLWEAQERGREATPEPKPSRSRSWNPDDRKVYDALRKRRAKVADQLGIDSGVLCPSRPLWDAVVADPADGEALCRAAGLRDWQVEVLADPLWDAYASTRDATARRRAAAAAQASSDSSDSSASSDSDESSDSPD